VIARFDGDSHFPAPVWAAARRGGDAALEASVRAALPAVEAAMRERLQRMA
jgi:hypothetical protein